METTLTLKAQAELYFNVLRGAVELDRVQERIINCGLQYDWQQCTFLSWDFRTYEYRVKPQPRQWWLAYPTDNGFNPIAYDTEREAKARSVNTVHVKEVI